MSDREIDPRKAREVVHQHRQRNRIRYFKVMTFNLLMAEFVIKRRNRGDGVVSEILGNFRVSDAFIGRYRTYVGKKRSLAKVFAAAAAVGGVSGAYLLLKGAKKPCCNKEQPAEDEEDLFGDGFDEDDVFCNFENEDEDCCCGDETEAGSEA